MNVTYLAPGRGGCDYYRGYLPLGKAHDQDLMNVRFVTPQDFVMNQRHDKEKFIMQMTADILVIPRSLKYSMHDSIVKIAKTFNPRVKVVIEYDDNIFKVSPLSPHYREHGTENVEMVLPDGSKRKIWQDGLNGFNIEKNRKMLEDVGKIISVADVVTTTTDILGDVFRRKNGNIKILPNCVDVNKWKRVTIDRKNKNEVRLFWSGGSSHYEDWYQLRDVLHTVLNKNKNVKLVLMGTKWDSTISRINPAQVEFHKWEEVDAYPHKVNLLDVDIGLIPLRDTEFNRCKSAIKWIEYGALGIPSISTYIPPYSEMEKLGEDNGVFVEENDQKGWVEALEILIADKEKRRNMGDQANKTVLKNFDVNDKCELWSDCYREIMKK